MATVVLLPVPAEPQQRYPPRLRAMIADGRAHPGRSRLADLFARIGARKGPLTTAGTHARNEQHGMRA